MKLFRFIRNLIRLTEKLLIISSNKLYIKALFKHKIAATVEHDYILKNLKLNTVIDIGSNKGQFILSALNNNSNMIIYAFEPIFFLYVRLKKSFKSFDNNKINIYNIGVGDKNVSGLINISKKNDSSSILEIGVNQDKLFPGTHKVQVEPIKISRLDYTLRPNNIIQPSLLKIDVQGYEKNVLNGVGELYNYIDYIYCECSMVELYKNQALFDEIYNYLIDLKYKLICIRNPYIVDGNLVQADFLFKK